MPHKHIPQKYPGPDNGTICWLLVELTWVQFFTTHEQNPQSLALLVMTSKNIVFLPEVTMGGCRTRFM